MEQNSNYLLLIGSYSSAEAQGLHTYSWDSLKEGGLKALNGAGGLANPTFLSVDQERNIFYTFGESEGQPVKEAVVAAYSFEPATGVIRELNRMAAIPAGEKPTTLCHIAKDPQSKYLVVCSYHGGAVGLLRLLEDGRVGELCDTQLHTGHGADPKQQDRPHPHSAVFSPDGNYIFVSDLGLDIIRTYKLDYEAGKLVPQGDTRLYPGAGPRHFVFHPDGKTAYVIGELGSTVTSFRYDPATGELHTVQTVSTLPEGYEGENGCAEIAVTPDGRFVYGSNRGHDSIAVFAVGEDPASLVPASHTPTRGGHPRHFALTPDGAELICANRDGAENLVVFTIDKESGGLTYTGYSAALPKPVCVIPVRR